MLMEKDSILCYFKFITFLFILYMLITGLLHLKKDFNNETDGDYEEPESFESVFDDINCRTPLFLVSFAFLLGAFWNQNKMIKFGVI